MHYVTNLIPNLPYSYIIRSLLFIVVVDFRLAMSDACTSESSEYQTTRLDSLPSAIQLIRVVPVLSQPNSVCLHDGVIYVGFHDGSIGKLDADRNITSQFVTPEIPLQITCITAHDSRLYTLTFGDYKQKVYVHSIDGEQLYSWQHGHTKMDHPARGLVIADNNLIIANEADRELTVYSLTGDKIRTVPCDLLRNSYNNYLMHNFNMAHGIDVHNHVCVINAGDESVIVTNYEYNTISRVSTHDGSVMWTSSDVQGPITLSMYGPMYCVVTETLETSDSVAARNTRGRITIIDIAKGWYVHSDDKVVCKNSITYERRALV